MTTAADIALRAARIVTDVMDGTATAWSATTLTDTANLIQPNAYWDRGTIYILSGANSGKAAFITGYASNRVTFASMDSAAAAADRYAVMRGVYPFSQILSSMMQALDSTHVTGVSNVLIGDGETLDFTLPAGVYNIKDVRFQRGNLIRLASHHWREVNGLLRFDPWFAPVANDVISIVYRKKHDDLINYASIINNEIDTEWLTYKTAENLLWWALGVYGSNAEFHIEERMNRIMTALKGRTARRDGPDIVLKTAGVYI